MMPITFLDCVGYVFKDEGGYVNDFMDKGGETNRGISKRAYPDEDIKGMTIGRAQYLYKRDYWDAGRCEFLPKEIRYIYFDTCINMGRRTAVKILQHAAKIKDDGIFGVQTLSESKKVTLKEYAIERIKKYEDIIEANPSQIKFRKGWLARVERIVSLSKTNI